MSERLELGTDGHGIRFDWTRTDPYIESAGRLGVHIWDGEWDEAAAIELDGDQARELAQWINDVTGRE